MKKFSDLNACIELLSDMQRGDDVNPKQKQAVENVIREIKKIRRKPKLKQYELHNALRVMAESLLDAFCYRD